MNEVEAYKAMFFFLEKLYEQTKSDDLGGFLGSMALAEDGVPNDPAMWNEWIEAINLARN